MGDNGERTESQKSELRWTETGVNGDGRTIDERKGSRTRELTGLEAGVKGTEPIVKGGKREMSSPVKNILPNITIKYCSE